MEDNVTIVQEKIEKLGIRSINQLVLQVPMQDGRFPATNLFTASLHYSKTAVIDYLLDRDMIDIANCCRRPLLT